MGIVAGAVLAAPANAAPARCSGGGHAYDATEEASLAALLKTNYGDAYRSFDLDRPSSINVGGRNLASIELGGDSWVAFSRSAKPGSTDVPTRIVVAFDVCSGRAVALQVLR